MTRPAESQVDQSTNPNNEAPSILDNAAEANVEPQEMPLDNDGTNGHSDEDRDSRLEMSRTVSIAETLSLPQEIMFVGCISLAQFCTQMGLGQVLSILHVIGDHFGVTDSGTLSWLIAGYSLTVGTFILMAGRFGDLFGHKKILLIGFAWFSLWSMITGLSVYSNHVLFIFARVLQGIGPAIVLPNGLAILGATYHPGPRKDMVFAIFGACAPSGSIIGAAMSGVYNLAWWPWTFWAFAIVLALIAVVGSFVIPDPPRKSNSRGQGPRSLRQTLEDLDILGGLVGVTALVLFNFAWNQAGVVTWHKAYVYVCLILGVLLVPVFLYIELHVSPAPLVPFAHLSSDVGFVLAIVACGWACFGIWIYYAFQFYQELKGLSPLLSTAWLCPVAVAGLVAAISTGFLLGRLRPAEVMTIALTAFTVGTILIATEPIHQVYWTQSFICGLIIPFGMDMSFPAATLILSNATPKEHQGVGASLVNTVVNYSISLGLGIAGTVEPNVNHGGVTAADTLQGYRGAFYLGIGLSGAGMGLSLLFLLRTHLRERREARQGRDGEKELDQ